jgi:tripartite-type tricarboxylate transporter receptor subunit TctC
MRQLPRRTILKALGMSAAASAFPLAASAQSGWPSKPIKIIVPVAAGGIIDLLARNVAEALHPRLNAPIIVDSRPGADHVIGTQAVAKSEPDGYTWLAASVPFTTTWHLRNKPAFDPLKDFVPVSLLAISPNVLVVPATLGINTFQEFIALGKKKDGGFTYANPGTGSSNHLGAEQLHAATGIKMLGVPYKGQPPAITDLLSGRVDFMLMSSALVGPYIESGRLKALATVAGTRLPKLPDVPTIKELGYPSVNVVPWFGIMMPAGTPAPVVERVRSEIRAVAATPAYREALARFGAAPAPDLTGDGFAAMLREEFDQWPALFKKAGLEKS